MNHEIDQIHKSYSAPVPLPTMHRSEQKRSHMGRVLCDIDQLYAHKGSR